ncbi:MAG: alpha/beta hydrolase [Streptosporangiaceae bacterium]
MPLIPGAEPYTHEGGPVGALLCHGFTSTPQSLRPWAEHLADAGLSVSLPRLPGHGTIWQEMARTRWEDWYADLDRAFDDLASRCDHVFCMGLSLGGCMALRLAEQRGDEVAGLVLVNPSLRPDNPLFPLLPLLRLAVRSFPGVAGDIKKEGVRELAYDRVPLRAAASLPTLWRLTRAELSRVTQPILLFTSADDHVVGPGSRADLTRGVSSTELIEHRCENSYHVAPLDNDASFIFAESLRFVGAHASAKATHDEEGG